MKFNDAQAVYDFVKEKLLAQGERSTNDGEVCMYRCGHLRCAAGHLIDDERYHSSMELRTVVDESVARALVDSGVPAECLGLVSDLQKVHDTQEPTLWAASLSVVAEKWGLRP